MEEQINEVFFMVLGAVMFITAVTLLLGYEKSLCHAYRNLYELTGNEYIVPY